MKILVTGGNGFIGRAVLERLTKDGHFEALGAVRTRPAEQLSGAIHVVGDIGPETRWAESLHRIDHVIHTAARVHVTQRSSPASLAEFRRVNVAGTLALARQSALAGVKRFVYLSSIKVNGESTRKGYPFTADSLPNPQDDYGISKHEAETGLRELATTTAMDVVIIRPPLVYGPGVKANFLTLLRWVQKGVPLPFRTLRNRRSLIAVDNLVDLIVRILNHSAAGNQVFLAGDGEDLSIPELVSVLARGMGRSPRLWPMPRLFLRATAVAAGRRQLAQRLFDYLEVDIGRTRAMLDWTPPLSVRESLRITAEHFRGSPT